MKREDIEKAAGDYSGSILGFTDNKSVMEKHKAFADGANWRINSVWHDANEEPEKTDRYILIDSVSYDGIRCYNVICARHYDKHPFNERWAYIEDLLPNKEE